jgi:hypothetical protein
MDIEIVPWDLEDEEYDDDLMNELIETNPAFREMLERSKASPRKPFDLGAAT